MECLRQNPRAPRRYFMSQLFPTKAAGEERRRLPFSPPSMLPGQPSPRLTGVLSVAERKFSPPPYRVPAGCLSPRVWKIPSASDRLGNTDRAREEGDRRSNLNDRGSRFFRERNSGRRGGVKGTAGNTGAQYKRGTSKTVVAGMGSHKFARRSNRNFRADLMDPPSRFEFSQPAS